jgi:hypothetical protein
MRRTFHHSLAAALAATAIAAPAAGAMPVRDGTASAPPHAAIPGDRSSEGAGQLALRRLSAAHVRREVLADRDVAAADAAAARPGINDAPWTTIGLGVAGATLLAATTAGAVRLHRRPRRIAA